VSPIFLPLSWQRGWGFNQTIGISPDSQELRSVPNISGVTPLTRKSGTSLDSAHLGRASNKRVLNALFLSAVRALAESALDRAYYDKKRADYQGHPKPHTAAVLALARQRHKVIYKLMTTDARYDKERLISSHLKRQREEAAA